MDTTNSTVQDPMKDLDKALKDFDISQFNSIGYEQIQEVAKQYLSSPDPERQKLGKELQQLDRSIFELSPAEESIQRVNGYLEKTGKTEDQIATFSTQVLSRANQEAVSTITSAMSEETYREWETLNEYDPNVLQQLYLLNEAANMLLKKSYDDIYEEELKKSIDFAVTILSNAIDKAELASKLTPEQANSVMAAFNANKFEIAIQLIYNFVNENESK
jgi:hypothetical protein